MSWEHVHLVTNHFPIVGAILAVGVLAYGWAMRARSVQRTGLALLVIAGLTGTAAYVSGVQAEETVEEWPGVSEDGIEDHEVAAKLAFIATLVAGAAAALALALSRGARAVPIWALGLSLALGAGSVSLLVGAAQIGGRIRHPELRPDWAPGAPAEEPVGNREDENGGAG
jgi:uncharacterized membrane protein